MDFELSQVDTLASFFFVSPPLVLALCPVSCGAACEAQLGSEMARRVALSTREKWKEEKGRRNRAGRCDEEMNPLFKGDGDGEKSRERKLRRRQQLGSREARCVLPSSWLLSSISGGYISNARDASLALYIRGCSLHGLALAKRHLPRPLFPPELDHRVWPLFGITFVVESFLLRGSFCRYRGGYISKARDASLALNIRGCSLDGRALALHARGTFLHPYFLLSLTMVFGLCLGSALWHLPLPLFPPELDHRVWPLFGITFVVESFLLRGCFRRYRVATSPMLEMDLVEKGFDAEDADEGRLKENRKKDSKALFILQQAVHETIFSRIVTASFSKEAWKILQKEFQGSSKVIAVKLQTLRSEFEALLMKGKRSFNFLSFDELMGSLQAHEARRNIFAEKNDEKTFQGSQVKGEIEKKKKKTSPPEVVEEEVFVVEDVAEEETF
ncbi:hypothetical protein ZIOFF_004982 [Zingiber officinale]|uniref:Uncharacterized protein n=1 Tax=Zingiber officinale TaxID=94328 RepID=A0A8J5M421_ZINOF|nr:hypothetical protein ZIOFF_004982 [Zingiber officinale]